MPTRSRAATYARRRKRRMAGRVHDLSDAQWAALVEAWGGCAYCGAAGPLQKDCMLPISRGGRYTVGNVVPACASCNASKGNVEVTTWIRRKKRDEGASCCGRPPSAGRSSRTDRHGRCRHASGGRVDLSRAPRMLDHLSVSSLVAPGLPPLHDADPREEHRECAHRRQQRHINDRHVDSPHSW